MTGGFYCLYVPELVMNRHSQIQQNNTITMLSRMRNMSGGSTGSAESDQGLHWANFKNPYDYTQFQQSMTGQFQNIHRSSITDSSENNRNIGVINNNSCQSSVLGSTHQANNNSNGNNTKQTPQVLNPGRYKTEMCRPFGETGHCKYGEKCQFAHGPQEMRGLPRHPKYKTELCRTFHSIGFCPYGPRCHFIHSEDEQKLVEIGKMKRQQQASQQAGKDMAQIQVLKTQLSVLMSQMQNQISNQLSVTSPTVYPQQITLGQSRGMPQSYTTALGSTGDSPPDSPVGSLNDDVFHHPSSSPVPLIIQPQQLHNLMAQNTNNNNNTTSIDNLSTVMGTLLLTNRNSDACSSAIPATRVLKVAGGRAAMIVENQEEPSPPSSPESLENSMNCKSNKSSSRLPVFSQIAAQRSA